DRISHRHGAGAHADGLRDLERYIHASWLKVCRRVRRELKGDRGPAGSLAKALFTVMKSI
ncbi:MAG: hypothetical protein ACT6U0_11725, partial [Shinella sp.]